jgi:hypothetical protein
MFPVDVCKIIAQMLPVATTAADEMSEFCQSWMDFNDVLVEKCKFYYMMFSWAPRQIVIRSKQISKSKSFWNTLSHWSGGACAHVLWNAWWNRSKTTRFMMESIESLVFFSGFCFGWKKAFFVIKFRIFCLHLFEENLILMLRMVFTRTDSVDKWVAYFGWDAWWLRRDLKTSDPSRWKA